MLSFCATLIVIIKNFYGKRVIAFKSIGEVKKKSKKKKQCSILEKGEKNKIGVPQSMCSKCKRNPSVRVPVFNK